MNHEDRFYFRNFSLSQRNCGMPISTDAVLLGAWCTINATSPSLQIMDIGTGTGLLSLLLCDRYPRAYVSAYEIEETAAAIASENFLLSPYSERLSLYHNDIMKVYNTIPKKSFDFLICNPPFYREALDTRNQARRLARYDTTLSIKDLFLIASHLLREDGEIGVLTPFETKTSLTRDALSYGFFLSREASIVTREGKKAKRLLTQWKKGEVINDPMKEIITIRDRANKYTGHYLALVENIYHHIK